MPLRPGLTASVTLLVTEADTAPTLGTGDVPVLATPRIVLLAERATVQAVEGAIPADHTTVGYRIQLDHLAPVAVGEEVIAEATLESIAGRRLTFRVSVKHRADLVAAGRVTRAVVNRERFLAKVTGTG